jgi:nitrile hydratase subunit beta
LKGVHDLGGKPGFGRVDQSGAETVFHDRWEAKVFAMVGAGSAAGAWSNTDRFRHAVERIDPEAYLTQGYYGRWLGGVETLLTEAGIVSQEEITVRAIARGASRKDLVAAQPLSSPDPVGQPPSSIGSDRTIVRAPEFKVGDQVRSLVNAVSHHTRLPEYVMGKRGQIVMHHNGWVFPDTNAHGKGENPKHLYTVKFSSEVLWGKPGFSVCVDLFEPYLESVDG